MKPPDTAFYLLEIALIIVTKQKLKSRIYLNYGLIHNFLFWAKTLKKQLEGKSQLRKAFKFFLESTHYRSVNNIFDKAKTFLISLVTLFRVKKVCFLNFLTVFFLLFQVLDVSCRELMLQIMSKASLHDYVSRKRFSRKKTLFCCSPK